MPGLSEFSRAAGGHAMRRGCGGRGGRRGRCGGRRGGMRKVMREMMERHGGNCEEMMAEVEQNGGPQAMMRRFMNCQQQEDSEQAQDAEQKSGCPFRRRCGKKAGRKGGYPWWK